METGVELRPCPFCGGRELRYMTLDVLKGKTMASVKCQKCLTCGPGEYGKDREEAQAKAAEAWNRRAAPENRVLTPKEIRKAYYTDNDEPPYLWAEQKRDCDKWLSLLSAEARLDDEKTFGRYGVLWRCWPRRPTAEEMANVPWEE